MQCFADCPGTSSTAAGKSDACAGCPNQAACATAPKGPDPEQALIDERMSKFKHIVLVLSGKGGVGKSTFAAQLAFACAKQNLHVGLLDIDICGPSTLQTNLRGTASPTCPGVRDYNDKSRQDIMSLSAARITLCTQT